MIYQLQCCQSPSIDSILKAATPKLNRFFATKLKPGFPRVILLPDRKTIDYLRGDKTKSWLVGWVDSRQNIFMLKRSVFPRHSSHPSSKSYFSYLLVHELVHVYTLELTKSSPAVPAWVLEGLAVYLSGQITQIQKPQRLRHFLKKFEDYPAQVYSEAPFAIEALIKRHGKKRLLSLLRSLASAESGRDFIEAFHRSYGFRPTYRNIAPLL